MNLRQICHEHCPRPGLGRGVAENVAESAALMFGVIVIAAAIITAAEFIARYIVVIGACAGFLLAGMVAGYVGVVGRKRRRRAGVAVTADVAEALAAHRARPLSGHQAALPPTVHNHYGHHLVLPDNPAAAAAAAKAMRGDQ